jgi:hypothetical protein
MPRVALVLFGLIAAWGSLCQLAAQGNSPDPSNFETSQNPALLRASRIDAAATQDIANQLRKIVDDPPLPRTRPAVWPPVTQYEAAEIRDNPLVNAASSRDYRDTVLWLRKINAILASEGLRR